MTVHDGMPYLRESVGSILRQDSPGFHFFIIDNGSTDGTCDYLEQTAARHGQGPPVLTVEHLPGNIGRTAALNRALNAVKTEFAAVMDADDIAMPARIARQSRVFQEHPGFDLCTSGISCIDGNGTVMGTKICPAPHEKVLEMMVVENPFARSALAFRVAAAREAGGFDERFPYSQDLALWIAMLAQGSRVLGIPEPLACIRVHPGQQSGQIALLRVRARDAYRLAGAILGIPGLKPVVRQAAMVRRAGALRALHHPRRAAEELWRAFKEAPLLLPFNPLIWHRIGLERRRRRGRIAGCSSGQGGAGGWR